MSSEAKHIAEKEKKPLNKKLLFIIGGAALAVIAAVVIIFAVLNSGRDAALPSMEQIKGDLGSRLEVTEVAIGKKTYTFEVDSVEIVPSSENLSEDKNDYSLSVDVGRRNEEFALNTVTYNMTYVKDGENYKFVSVETAGVVKLELSPLKGVDKEKALKKVRKTYKKAKFKSQTTDLEKGKDKLAFTVDDKEYEGTAVAVYSFDKTKGWVFKKLDDKKVSFKKGVTHKENGLYTNSAVKNILFLGVDSFDYAGRSDVMMLVSIDMNNGKIKQTSFMRDNYFDIPGYGKDKLNAAYAYDGAELTVKTIEGIFDIKIDHYVATNFSTFRNIINILGGIDVEIDSDEAGYINWQIDHNNQAAVGKISEAGGVTHLNGQQALWLCRDRGNEYFSGDDFMRTGRQRRVIQALVNTYKDLTPDKVLSLLKELKSNVRTDMSVKDIAWYAVRSPKFFTYKFQERCVPTDGEWSSGYSDDGMWIIVLNDFAGLKSEVQHDIYEDLD